MKISIKDVEYVANLARLELSEQEKEKFARQLENILDYIGKLNEVNTDKVPPTSNVIDLKNVWREDDVAHFDGNCDIVANAPEQEAGLFRVKKIIE
ncbi:MAG: asparaginyl/glutamyl-tRNA amidotransferase subunit C [Elusimicrobia bacterium RIFOXYB2_FULL_48_7]|nr:MAG: asparaginyl/glutamyl-tRNA amidotransferase subunit C [Elusimicrobia bacterium RIFOXYB2_FULL_48_7]